MVEQIMQSNKAVWKNAMIFRHEGKTPRIARSMLFASNDVICGDIIYVQRYT
jgi:hypothetical protein